MKKLSFLALTALTLGLFSCKGASDDAVNEVPDNAVKVQLDKDASDILWVGKQFKDGAFDHEHEGKLAFKNGHINVVDDALLSGEFEIDMTTMEKSYPPDEESAAKLIGHLKSEDFFDVEKFPTATVVISGYDNGKVKGTLTLKGVSMPFEQEMKFGLNGDYYSLEGRFDLDFAPFKMDGIGSKEDKEYVSPEINIDVYVEFKKN